MICYLIDEIAIVADEKHRAVESLEGFLQGIASPKIKVIRRLIQHQKIGVRCGQAGKRRAAAFAAAELANLLQSRIAGQAEAGQQVTPLLGVELLMRGADGIDHVHIVRNAGKMLVEVTYDHALP